MAWTTEAAFERFYDEVNLPGDHRATANLRRDWVLGRLRNNGIDVLDAIAFGSIPRYTALKGARRHRRNGGAALRQAHPGSPAVAGSARREECPGNRAGRCRTAQRPG